MEIKTNVDSTELSEKDLKAFSNGEVKAFSRSIIGEPFKPATIKENGLEFTVREGSNIAVPESFNWTDKASNNKFSIVGYYGKIHFVKVISVGKHVDEEVKKGCIVRIVPHILEDLEDYYLSSIRGVKTVVISENIIKAIINPKYQ